METDTDVVFKAVADSTRRRILSLLEKSGGEMSITQLSSSFEISRQAITKHLNVLIDANLVWSHKNGRERLFRPHFTQLKAISTWAAHYERFWQDTLGDLGRHLEEHPH